MEKLFAVSAPGLEPYTAVELRQLGLLPAAGEKAPPSKRPKKKPTDKGSGGVAFSGNLETIYMANASLRTASRILVRLGEFHAAAFSELRKKAARLAWDRYLIPGQPVALRVSCRKSRLYHSSAVAERVAGAIGDRLGQPAPVLKFDAQGTNQLPQLIFVRLVRDRCTISIDSSGELLHRRGYRLETAKAPIRETLAAGMLLACSWDAASPLLDPFCGSGTIPIEAALLAGGISPGSMRHFSFMDWFNFNAQLWEKVLDKEKLRTRTRIPKIIASDRDAGAIRIAQANAERAGVANDIEFSCRAVSAIEPHGSGWVVTNPPYGMRVSKNKDLRNLYAQFGNVLRAKCPAWHVAFLCNDLRLIHNTGLRLDTSLSLDNGGVAVKLARGQVEDLA